VMVRMQSDSNASAYVLADYWGSFYTILRAADLGTDLRFIQSSDSFNGGRLKDFSVRPQASGVVRLEVSGYPNPPPTAYVNGTSLGSVVDTGTSDWSGNYPPLAGGQTGVFLYRSGDNTLPKLSNWSTGDLNAPAGTAVPTGTVTFYDGATTLNT